MTPPGCLIMKRMGLRGDRRKRTQAVPGACRRANRRFASPARGAAAWRSERILAGFAKIDPGTLVLCESWDLRFRTLSREIATTISNLSYAIKEVTKKEKGNDRHQISL
jgi:hypothetical protein